MLFSFVNLAADGYQLTVEYTTNPNATIASHLWIQHWPFSFFVKTPSTCQSQNFQVNSQIFTDKLSLPYTITGVFQNETTGNVTVLPSLQYTSNVLKNCTINEMVFDLESSSRTANQQTTFAWGVEASVSVIRRHTVDFLPNMAGQAYITCYVDNGDMPTWLNLTTTYDYVPSTVTQKVGHKGIGFLQLDKQKKASLWWGQSLMYVFLSLMAPIRFEAKRV